MSESCSAVIDLRKPVRSERVRGFQPPWRTVYVYACPSCKAERRVRACSFRGSRAEPSVGGMVCGCSVPAREGSR
jgi:hypothetical protein